MRFPAGSSRARPAPQLRCFPLPPVAAGSRSFLAVVADPPSLLRRPLDSAVATDNRSRPTDPIPTGSLSWAPAIALPVRSLLASSRASSVRTACGPEALILAFFQCQIRETQIRNQEFEPLILLPQILHLIARRF